MKVKELIEQLSTMDQEADVWLYDGEWSENPCQYVEPWLEQGQWAEPTNPKSGVVMVEFETPRVLLQ